MPVQVIMPQLGESVVEGTVSKWLKSIGDKVDEFEPLLEVNTDKVDSEIPSPGSGIILDILIPEGTLVTAGTLLAWIGDSGEKAPVIIETVEPKPPVQVKGEIFIPPGSQVPLTTKMAPTTQTPVREKGLGFISPVVAKISSEHGIDLAMVPGTGQGGRITKKDVLEFIANRPEETATKSPVSETVPSSQAVAPLTVTPGEILPLNNVRRAIAEHMVQSKHTSPHVSTIMEADLSRVVAHREAHKEAFSRDGVNLTFTAYFISAIVAGLKTHPMVNSSWTNDGIFIHRELNIGMATSLGEAGLIVPVIKNADSLSLLGLARTINDLANRARNRQLKPDEVKGGTFTLTNHGISGSLFATPIINQPQCGILGVGAIQKRVIVIDDAIAIRPMVYISLTFDHRILDGAIADYFLGEVVKSLQNWG